MEDATPLIHEPDASARAGWRVPYLHVNALMPAVVVGVALGVFHSALLALFTFHGLCLVAMPALYIAALPRDAHGATGAQAYDALVRRLLADERGERAAYAALAFVTMAAVGFVGYLVVRGVINARHAVAVARGDGLNSRVVSDGGAVALCLYFTFVNSALEELFWRVYLHRELARAPPPCAGAARADAEPPAPAAWFGAGAGAAAGGAGLLAELLSARERPKLIVSCYYASYHFVVVLFFVPWYLAVPAAGGLVVLGRAMVFLRDSERFGLVTAWGFHAGLDACFCLVMLQMYFHWL